MFPAPLTTGAIADPLAFGQMGGADELSIQVCACYVEPSAGSSTRLPPRSLTGCAGPAEAGEQTEEPSCLVARVAFIRFALRWSDSPVEAGRSSFTPYLVSVAWSMALRPTSTAWSMTGLTVHAVCDETSDHLVDAGRSSSARYPVSTCLVNDWPGDLRL